MNPDWKAEQSRVDERVEKEAAGDSPEARTFWSNKSKGSVLARMLDHTWRAALLLEGCRRTLLQINKVYFPHNEQPSGLVALLERFREGKALKEVVHGQLVGGRTWRWRTFECTGLIFPWTRCLMACWARSMSLKLGFFLKDKPPRT